MPIVAVGRWTLRSDPERTRAAYSQLTRSAADECACYECQNFEAYRSELLRGPVGPLLDSLGVDPPWEIECVYLGRKGLSRHAYHVSYHVVGELVSGAWEWRPFDNHSGILVADLDELAPGVAVACRTKCSEVRASFKGLPLIQLEIQAQLPWVIDAPEPD